MNIKQQFDTISGSSKGLQPMGKGKRPLPQGGAPDPKQRIVRDQGKPYVFYPCFPVHKASIFFHMESYVS